MFLRSLFAELPRLTAHSQPVFADISTIDVKTYGGGPGVMAVYSWRKWRKIADLTRRRTGELLAKHSKNRLIYHLSDDNCYMKNIFQNLI